MLNLKKGVQSLFTVFIQFHKLRYSGSTETSNKIMAMKMSDGKEFQSSITLTAREMTITKMLCVVTRQWLNLQLLGGDCIRRVPTWIRGGGQT